LSPRTSATPKKSKIKPVRRSDRFSSLDRPSDQRSPAQRDRDRILFTSAFRRLAGITQVVAADEGHIFHNRLTHSLEVAQVGRRLTEKFIAQQPSLARRLKLDPDVVEAACLAHDLGHPPFGHIAEKTLDKLAKARGLSDGFEGNAQSFRIVTKLAFRSPQTVGLNLTRATLNAILKYPWHRGAAGKKERKWSAYHTEADEFAFARKLMAIGSEAQSPEAQIMDWADDITYSVHDLEDFYRAGFIPLHRLVSQSVERNAFYEKARIRLGDDGLSANEIEEHISAFESFKEFPIDSPYRGTQQQRSDLRTFTAGLIGRYVSNSRLVSPVGVEQRVLEISPGYKKEIRMLKQLTVHYVIYNPSLATQQKGQQTIIEELFNIYCDAAHDSDLHHLLPQSAREQVEDAFKKKAAERRNLLIRIVLDLISGMTERHAVLMYRRLKGVSMGSVLDPIL
jgi:dGTPase